MGAEGFKPSASANYATRAVPNRDTSRLVATGPTGARSEVCHNRSQAVRRNSSAVSRDGSLTWRTESMMSACTAGTGRPARRMDTTGERLPARITVRSTSATRGGERNTGTVRLCSFAEAAIKRTDSANLSAPTRSPFGSTSTEPDIEGSGPDWPFWLARPIRGTPDPILDTAAD